MPERFKTIAVWLTASGIKVFGILIALIIHSQMSKRIVKLRRRIKNRFDEKGIHLPFPHRVLIRGGTQKRSSEWRVMNDEFKSLNSQFIILNA